MERQYLQIEGITADELLSRFEKIENILSGITAKEPEKQPNSEYLTRYEVAKIFNITLMTVHQWTVKGILNVYKVGNRAYYKRREIEQTYTKKVSRKNANR